MFEVASREIIFATSYSLQLDNIFKSSFLDGP